MAFDIFKLNPKGEPVWIESVETLRDAMMRVDLLRENFPGEYKVHSQITGKDIHFKADGGIYRS